MLKRYVESEVDVKEKYEAPIGFFRRGKNSFFLINNEAVILLFVSTNIGYAILKVTRHLLTRSLKSLKKTHKVTKIMVKGLPLIKLSERDKTYYRSSNPDEGLTFYDRLILISSKPDSIYACMRLSSNYLAATAQYYNALINSMNFFDINKLEFIQ